MITLIAVAALLAQTPASPARAKEPWPVIVRWETRGFCPALLPGTSDANPAHLPQTEKPSTLIELIVKSSGLTGNATAGAAGAATWEMRSGSLTAVLAGGPAERGAGPFVDRPYGRFDAHPDLPEGWIFRDAKAGGTQGVVLTIDLNAARTSTEQLFDAPWVQRLLDRLALDNARLVSLRATLNPPTADGLPRLLELKALVSARSNQPGKNVTQITLVAPGWGGTNAEAEAVKGANWAASVRSDTRGLGVIGRDGGVGTWAGLVRLATDAVGTVSSDDTEAWAKAYTGWQERTGESLRAFNARLQPRGTLACFGALTAPDLVLLIPSRSGEQAEPLAKAVAQFAKAGGMASTGGVYTVESASALVPKLAVTVTQGGAGPYVVASIEHDRSHPLLKQTVQRLRAAK